jgi:ribosomal protein S18 acetylase RimI-like enzyme
MEIKSLEKTGFQEILDCFNLAFSDYFVKFEATYDYLWERWLAADVDYSFSFGAFAGDRLVGFIISGEGVFQGKRCIYNAGTGVIPEYRGRRIVEQIYEVALEKFRMNGIEQLILEVITENWKAIKAYKKVGFEIKRELACLNGIWEDKKFDIDNSIQFEISGSWNKSEFESLNPTIPTWESSHKALMNRADNYLAYKAYQKGNLTAMFIMATNQKVISQILMKNPDDLNLAQHLMYQLQLPKSPVKLNNLDAQYQDLLNLLLSGGIEMSLMQYEMVFDL